MYNNYEYKRKLFKECDKIWIDTCTLMYTERMNTFINEAKEILIDLEKKITIHNLVMAELYKFSDCNNFSKKVPADKALTLINSNLDVFEIAFDSKNIFINKRIEIFADPNLLIELLTNRRYENQLLISNDHELTLDAFNLNFLNSFNGGKINVCYLNKIGEMHMCQCVKPSLTREPEAKIIYQEVIVEKAVERESSFLEKHGLKTGLFTGALLTTIAFNYKSIFNFAKSYI